MLTNYGKSTVAKALPCFMDFRKPDLWFDLQREWQESLCLSRIIPGPREPKNGSISFVHFQSLEQILVSGFKVTRPLEFSKTDFEIYVLHT